MRAVIYGRVSTEKQEKQETINSQLEALREFAKQNSYAVSEEYIDEGYSGELLDRPALDKLRDDAQKKQFDSVLIYSPDRLSRDHIYQGIVIKELEKFQIPIIFLSHPQNSNSPSDKLLFNVQAVIAEYEKAMILERTRRGKIHKAKSNLLVGNLPPYGYNYIKGNRSTNTIGYYEVINKEAKVVRLIFDLFVNKHLSIRAIAKELTRRGIQPRNGKYWRTSSLHRILRNTTYIGITYYNKHISVETDNHKNGNKYRRAKNTGRLLRPKDQWIRITLPDNLKIIDRKIFDLTQGQLKRNSNLSPRNVKYQYLLRGLVKCGNCDSPFYGTPYHGKLFYRCGNRDRTFPKKKECKRGAVKADDLEDVVWNKFSEAIKNPRLITEQVAKLKNKAVKSKDSIKRNVESLDRELRDTENESDRLLDAYREKIITMEQLKDQMVKIQAKQKQLEADKQALVNKQDNSLSPLLAVKTVDYFCKQIESRLNSLRDDFEGKRYLLSLAINKIVLEGKTVRIKGILPIYTKEKPVFSDIVFTSSGHCDRLLLLPQELVLHVPGL